jgi:hypothetical protein
MEDEVWAHRFDLIQAETVGMELHIIPKKNKFKSAPSSAKIMATVFFDGKGVIFVNFFPSRTTLNSHHYTELF